MELEERQRPVLKKYLWHGLGILLIVGVPMFMLELRGFFEQWQTASLDRFLLRSTSQSSDVLIVRITEPDYENSEYFNGQSPLNVQWVKSLILKVADQQPAVIGVDLDLSASPQVIREIISELGGQKT